MRKKESENQLVFLGVWDILPLRAWQWFSEISSDYFYKLTNYKIQGFTYIKDGLHYQFFLKNKEIINFEKYFKNLSNKNKKLFINKISKNYYNQVNKVKDFLNELKSIDFSKEKNNRLIFYIKKTKKLWSNITMDVWFSLLLDIWYPNKNLKEIKKIVGKYRDDCGYLHENFDKIEDKLYKEVSKRLNTSLTSLYYCFPKEVVGALNKNKSLEKIGSKRKKFCLTILEKNKNYNIFSGKEAKKIIKKYNLKNFLDKKLNKLSGTPANGGHVIGIVRKILKKDDFNKFKKGEILVAFQTMVDYIPIMKKSKAILTQFGGLTSHAAIIGRELKKPSIVGIDYLISSLKNKDKIEVDANKGIVRILERKK